MMRTKHWLLAGALLCTAPYQAAYAEGGRDTSARSEQGQKEDSKNQQKQQKLSGKVKQSRQVRVGTSKGEDVNRIVLLETSKGKTVAVDLGSESKLKDVQVKRGTPVTVTGSVVNVDGRPVFLAQQAEIGGKSMQASRGAPDQSRRPKVQSFSGTINQLRDVGVKGTDTDHKVAVLQADKKGRKLLVDLGPKDQLSKLKLGKGDEVRVQGIAMNLNQRRVLVAQTVAKDGKSTQIQREALPHNLSMKKGKGS